MMITKVLHSSPIGPVEPPEPIVYQDGPPDWDDERCLNMVGCQGDSCCRYSDRYWKNYEDSRDY